MANLALPAFETIMVSLHSISRIGYTWDTICEEFTNRHTIVLVQHTLLVIECKSDLSVVQKSFIADLNDAVYDADDFWDEVRTLAEHTQISRPPPSFYPRAKVIKDRLDDILNHTKFMFNNDPTPIRKSRPHTCSNVNVQDIIGRDKDKDAIIDMLLSPDTEGVDADDIRFLTIVGMAGLGKTALAQLVFNDDKIQNEFSSSLFWVCVGDVDGVVFYVRTILSGILQALTSNEIGDNSSIINQFLEQIRGRKYLLVLDDVWNENRENWIELERFLRMGARGSRIVVTSRSESTGTIIGHNYVYELQALSNKDSQRLFEMTAFGAGEKPPEFVEIGKNIVSKCCGNPLVIKGLGSLLYGQDISKWQSIEEVELVDIFRSWDVFSILSLSYINLTPSLRSCITYCALFPKDFKLDKEMLIDLWIAQGYIVPVYADQSFEDAAEEYFSVLMRRFFFQDIEKDNYGNVRSVKIHELMHDVAKEMGKEEICVISSNERKPGDYIRHVNIIDNNCAEISLCWGKMRSYVCKGWREDLLSEVKELIPLRVLDLSYSDVKTLPQTLDKLLLLRYLNLSNNMSLEGLPDSITILCNLQTLLLHNCKSLREVPNDFSNLINLRHFDLYGCDTLNGMPSGILKLKKLRVLPYFVEINEITEQELKVLQQVFTSLKGKICVEKYRGRENLKTMKPLVKLTINFVFEWVICEDILLKLKLPPFLNAFWSCDYGKTISWLATCFPTFLLHLEIIVCSDLERIPVVSELPNLQSLKLSSLDNVEYIENERSSSSNNTKVIEVFPSLQTLEINTMRKLRGWWNGDFPAMKLRFPRLSNLRINGCPDMTSFLPCSDPKNLPTHHLPILSTLQIIGCPNLALNLVCPQTLEKLILKASSERLNGDFGQLRDMVVDKVEYLKLLPATNCLTSLHLTGYIEVESALECVQRCASSLRTLHLIFCENLTRLPRLDHFIGLEQLTLRGNFRLSICEDDEEPWKYLPQSLRLLVFSYLPRMKSLPKGICHLSSLQSLKIWDCEGIKSLPEAIKDLTSLEKLSIRLCPHLKERCKEPNGEDFSKIQHIPDIEIF